MANWKPKSIVTMAQLVDDKLQQLREAREERFRESEKQHQEWLQSPEGVAATKAIEEKDALAKQRDEWVTEYNKITSKRPEPGIVIRNVSLTFYVDDNHPTFEGRLTTTEPEFPTLPAWIVNTGRYGTRCFLRRRDAEELRETRFPDKGWGSIKIAAVRIIGYSVTGKAATLKIEEL